MQQVIDRKWTQLKQVCRTGWHRNNPDSPCSASVDTLQPWIAWFQSMLGKIEPEEIIDVGCGDLYWMKEIQLDDIGYYGCDWIQYPSLNANLAALRTTGEREFQIRDISQDELPRADLMICLSVLIHMPNDMALQTLDNLLINSTPKYFMASHHRVEHNLDRHRLIRHPSFSPMNLRAYPFNFGPPIYEFEQPALENKNLIGVTSVWQL